MAAGPPGDAAAEAALEALIAGRLEGTEGRVLARDLTPAMIAYPHPDRRNRPFGTRL
nr:hypothetical protein [Thioalkalivibrio sp.]